MHLPQPGCKGLQAISREVRVRDVRMAFRAFKCTASADRIKAGKSYSSMAAADKDSSLL